MRILGFDFRFIHCALANAIVIGAIALLYLAAGPHHYAHANDRKFVVVSSQTRWAINVQQTECLSLNRRIANKIFGRDYSDDPQILNVLRRYFPNKKIALNDPECPYARTFNVLVHDVHAVSYLGQISRMLVTFVVSKKSDDATGMPTKTRSYKNLYLFRTDLDPLDAFEVGLKAFLAPQQTEWQTIVISLPGHA